ncbi:cytosine permease [Acetomicrobium flavidum]|uniref:Cytosine permease n=1 Tax=Acetomicrobium flavidum TaxID=49896 RepID=A0ABY1JAK7_9BACT|nr:cytosine permease [Acetomicrobium flavidum]
MQEREELILNPVPQEERTGWRAPLFNILGCNIAISELMVGGALIAGMTFKDMAIASVIGNLLLVVILSIQGYIGYKEGLNTYILAKGAFGNVGGKWIISLILGITSFGWFGVQAGVAGLSIQKIFPSFNFTITTIVIGLLMVIVATYGFKTMAVFNYIAIPPLIILLTWGLIKTVGINNIDTIKSYIPSQHISLKEGINMVVGLIIVGAVISPDYLRYAKRTLDIFMVGFIGFAIISIFQQIAAGIIAMQAPTWDITEVLAQLGFNWIAFAILLLAAWSTNLSNAYSGGLALKNLFPNINRSTLTFIAGLIGTTIAALGIVFKFQSFLGFLSMMIPSIAGVMWVEYYIIQGRQFRVREGINVPAFLAWLLGFLISYLSTKYQYGLPPINGIVSASILYLVFARLFHLAEK